jgi:hypothetical protein
MMGVGMVAFLAATAAWRRPSHDDLDRKVNEFGSPGRQDHATEAAAEALMPCSFSHRTPSWATSWTPSPVTISPDRWSRALMITRGSAADLVGHQARLVPRRSA